MLAGKLLEAANLIDLSQSAVARHLGITRAQVSLWALNKQAVSKRYQEALVRLVVGELQKAIAARQPMTLGDAFRSVSGLPPAPESAENLRAISRSLLDTWMAENLEQFALGPTANAQGVLEALEHFKAMSPDEMRKPANAQQLKALAGYLQEYATLIELMGPTEDILEEHENANNVDPVDEH